MTNNKEELKLIVKCTDEVKYGKLQSTAFEVVKHDEVVEMYP